MKQFDVNPIILKAEDYRSFLLAIVQARADAGGKINFSDLTRRAGFKSRSYIQEVLSGKKRIAAQSLPRFVKAFRLNSSLATLFTYLVALEETDVNFENLTEVELKRRILVSRERLSRQIKRPGKNQTRDTFPLGPKVLVVYAALGRPEEGATLAEILGRTRLSEPVCRKILDEFLAKNVVTFQDGRYFISQSNVDLSGLGASDAQFRNIFGQAVAEVSEKYRAKLDSREELFFYSAFSVNKKDLPEIKKRMREVILEYIDSQQSDAGDTVAQALIAFYN